jgi:maltose O-acetyltransferase
MEKPGPSIPSISIGNRTFVGHGCTFSAARNIVIGSECLVSAGVRIHDNDGHPMDAAKRRAGETISLADVQEVRIEDGVWIGAGAVILKGVTIGRDSVIGAGAVVTRDVSAGSTVAGNPARDVTRTELSGER